MRKIKPVEGVRKKGGIMAGSVELLTKTSKFVLELFKEKLPDWAIYHTYSHTVDTVKACREIGRGSKLSWSELEIVCLAAWFHDTGYTESHNGHEEKSVEIASRFLKKDGYPQEKINQVADCIMATKVPQRPSNLSEQVLCDADMIYLGTKRFIETNDMLKMEIEKREGNHITRVNWLKRSIDLLSRHRFHTEYAQTVFDKQRNSNLLKLKEQLRDTV